MTALKSTDRFGNEKGTGRPNLGTRGSARLSGLRRGTGIGGNRTGQTMMPNGDPPSVMLWGAPDRDDSAR